MAKTKHKKSRLQTRLAKKRAQRKASADSAQRAGAAGPLSLPLHECKVNENFREAGAAFVCVSRSRSATGLAGAAFFVDLWGIGLKDCFRTDALPASALDFDGSLQEQFGAKLVDCDEHLARQLVWGGAWKAKAEGFRLPQEFQSCKQLLARLEKDEVDWGFFGKDGETLIIGDLDDLERRSRGPLDLNENGRRFIVGCEPGRLCDDDYGWRKLFEKDGINFGPGKERLLFVEGTLYGESFRTLFSALKEWPDLDLVQVDEETETARFDWSRQDPRGHRNPFSRLEGAPRSPGELRIDGEALTILVKGKSWMIIMMDRLIEEFDGGITLGPMQIKDPLERRELEQKTG